MTLGRNILWNLVGLVWITLLVIVVMPVMVRGLGLEAFGIWAVLAASTGYLSTLDFGLNNALIRFVSAEKERERHERAEEFFRSGLTLQLLMGALTGGLLVLAAPFLARDCFHVEAGFLPEAITAFRISGVSLLLGFLIGVFAAIPAAMRRFDLLTARTVLFMTLQYGLIVLALRLGGGLREVVLANLLGSLIGLVFLVAVARNLLPGTRLGPGWHSGAAREFLRFGRYKFVAQLSWTLMREFDRIAIGLLLPVAMVSFYAVPLRLAQRTSMIVEQVASPFYPSITRQMTSGQTDSLRSQYRIGTRIIALVCMGMVAVLGGLARPLLSVWLGEDFAASGTWALRILLLAYAAGACFTLPSVAADAAGRPGLPAALLAIASLVHVPLVLLGIHLWGITGAAWGLLAGMLLLLFGAGVIHRRLAELPSVSVTLRETRGAVLAGLFTGSLALLVARSPFPGSGIVPLLLSLLGMGLVYVLFLYVFRGFLPEDARRIAGLLREVQRGPNAVFNENRLRASRER